MFLSRPVAWLEWLACTALLAMMLIVVTDVGGRYLVGSPLPGAIELVQYAMVVVVFGGLPAVTLRRRHISLDLVHDRLSGLWRRLHWTLLCTSSAAVLAVQAWLLADIARTMHANDDVIGFLNLPTYPAAGFMSALSLLTALALAWAALRPPTTDASDVVH